MKGITLREVIESSGGRVVGDIAAEATFPRVEVDPGKVTAGDLFVAVPGERLDGHEFAVVAALRGAAAALVSETWASTLRELPLPLVVVEGEPAAALRRIAAARRETIAGAVVGITGSVGKTSTKEAVAAAAATRFRTHRSRGNMNNELGLPLSLLAADTDDEVVVLELAGAYAPGEIAQLAEIARPHIGVVTNVFPVHLERMGTLRAIAETKAELVEALSPDDVAVLNGDDPLVRAMATRCRGAVVLYGEAADSDVRAEDVRIRGLAGCSFRATVAGQARRVELPLVGGHAVELALASLAVGHVLGLCPDDVLQGLSDPDIQIRLRRVQGPGGSVLVDDTYNASPPSVLSTLRLLETTVAGRRVAVLGDMLELGAVAEREHARVGEQAARVVDLLVTFGELGAAMGTAATRAAEVAHRPITVRSFTLDERSELVGYLGNELRRGDVAIVKGSRALRMDELVRALGVSPR